MRINNEKLLHHLFEEMAATYPDNIAVFSSSKQITYRELSKLTNKIAKNLITLESKPNTLIAVVMEKGWEQIVAVLSVLKAGAAYLPIEPAESLERIKYLITQGYVKIVLTEEKFKEKLQYIRISKILSLDQFPDNDTDSSFLLAKQKITDLAYVIYTSGSTGTPKGVMITHGNVINTIEDINKRFLVKNTDKIYGLSSLNFDLSVYDIFGSLAAGATLVLPNNACIKNPAHWIDQLVSKEITIWNSVPMYFQMLIEYMLEHNCKQDISLRLVFLSGDWIPVSLVSESRKIFKDAEIVSLGGATEASIWSILYRIKEVNPEWKSIPYGKPMHNQYFRIYDDKLNLLKDGEIGQLYIGGNGVAKGYWQDDVLTAKKFITHPVTQEYLYKTGDLGKYRPDGNIEFLGRIDYQVKIGGHRIDIAGIENMLCNYPAINQVLVAPIKRGDRYTTLQAYIVMEEPKNKILSGSQKLLSKHIASWFNTYEIINQKKYFFNNTKPLNISGWISSYTGELFSECEMEEWINNTVNRIFMYSPKKVLEIGCGLGLLLFRIAPGCQRYVGTDFSKNALDFIGKNYKVDINNSIDLLCREADNFNGLSKEFDTVIINSVAQYFPHIDYLNSVIEQAIGSIDHSGQIFIGDVRNLTNIEQFYQSVILYQHPDLNKTLLQLNIEDKFNKERELLVAPQYFYSLAHKHSQISLVDIKLKEGTFYNEMNVFRYDVVLHINKEILVLHGEQISWHITNYKQIEKILKQNKPLGLKIINIPNKRIYNILRINDSSIDPSALFELGEVNGYCVQIFLSPKNNKNIDAFFYKKQFSGQAVKFQPLNNFIDECAAEYVATKYSNLPIKATFVRELEVQLRNYLKNNFPIYTKIASFFFINNIPLTENKKIDRTVFYDISSISTKEYIVPRTPTEKKLAKIWQKTFNLTSVGVKDDFGDLGGDSLSIINLSRTIEKAFSITWPLEKTYKLQTIQKVGRKIDAILQLHTQKGQNYD